MNTSANSFLNESLEVTNESLEVTIEVTIIIPQQISDTHQTESLEESKEPVPG